jgi:hypothetical protein
LVAGLAGVVACTYNCGYLWVEEAEEVWRGCHFDISVEAQIG